MKNFEKYEKQIKEARTQGNMCETVEKLSGKKITLVVDFVDWLYEEYKEPLLTDEEREYLKAVIEPFRDRVTDIESNGYVLKIGCDGCVQQTLNIEIPIFYNLFFQNLKENVRYSLEELGLD